MARTFIGYKTYLFKDKDPVIDLLRTIIFKEKSMTVQEVKELSGVSSSTLTKWFYGETRRPQHATVKAVAIAIGYEYRLVPVEDRSNVRQLIPKTRKA